MQLEWRTLANGSCVAYNDAYRFSVCMRFQGLWLYVASPKQANVQTSSCSGFVESLEAGKAAAEAFANGIPHATPEPPVSIETIVEEAARIAAPSPPPADKPPTQLTLI